MEHVINLLATYGVLHVTYSDMGLELSETQKKLATNPIVISLLLFATAMVHLSYNVNHSVLIMAVFYALSNLSVVPTLTLSSITSTLRGLPLRRLVGF
jgi:hypothetical protein